MNPILNDLVNSEIEKKRIDSLLFSILILTIILAGILFGENIISAIIK